MRSEFWGSPSGKRKMASVVRVAPHAFMVLLHGITESGGSKNMGTLEEDRHGLLEEKSLYYATQLSLELFSVPLSSVTKKQGKGSYS
jgi:hypothetical protein